VSDKLKNQTAVVTGAGTGIGKSIAMALAGEGATLLLVGRRADALDSTRCELLAFTNEAHVCVCDLSDDRDIARLRAEILARSNRVDILVHSAGGIALGRLESMPVQEFDRQFDVNVRAPFLLTQSLLPAIKAAHGQIVFINSSVVAQAKEEVGAYAASKHALRALVDVLRMEVNNDGVRVLSVFPGNTASPMQDAVQKHTGRRIATEYLLQPEDVAGTVVNALTLPRTAEVTDIHIRPFRKPPP
jgi:NADP-dependent 3-hydroxy acid dehydrogenase YdfG